MTDAQGMQLSFETEPEDEAAAEVAAIAVTESASPHPPTPEQGAAIDARDRDVFLEAGAGTGKTRVLVSRYCDAVDLDGVEPERILAFTFTERAAAEMRRRVRIELARRAALASDPERRARLTTAARAGESTPITTIHGFCRRLLAAHPVAAGLDPRFRVLDAEEASRLAAQAYDEALAERAATDDDLVRAAAGYRWRLAGIVRAAYSDMRNRGERRPELPPIQIAGLEGPAAKAADDEAREMIEQAGSDLRGDPRPDRGLRRALRGALRGAVGSRLRRPAARRARAAPQPQGDRRGPAGALRPPARRRVPGHEPAPGRARPRPDRTRHPPVRRRRRVPVDLRVPRRRPRELPPRAQPDQGASRRQPRRGRRDAAERQLPLRPRHRRRRQRGRRIAARRLPSPARRPAARRRARGSRRAAGRAAADQARRLAGAGEPDSDGPPRRAPVPGR